MSNEKFIGWDGSALWQNDFTADSTSCSQSYIIKPELFTVPAWDLKSDLMRAGVWREMKAQTLDISQEGSLLRVTVSYSYGDNPSGEEQEKELAEGVAVTISSQAVLESILASPEVREDPSISQADLVKLALFANGQLIKQSNGKYSHQGDAKQCAGVLEKPTGAAGLLWDRLAAGEKTFLTDTRQVSFAFKVKKLDLSLFEGVGFKDSKLPSYLELPEAEGGREYLLSSVSSSYGGDGKQNLKLVFQLSPFGGWNTYLYSNE